MLVSIVIPAFNEEENLEQLFREVDEALINAPHEIEVIIVNDNSTDGTKNILERLKKLHPFIKLINLKERGGQTGCFQVGFQEAKGEYIIRMDSDLQDHPKDLKQFFRAFEEKPDMIMGLREMRKHHRFLRIATVLYDALIMILFDSPFHTNSSSFIAFKAEFVKEIPFRFNDHRYLPIIAMHRGAERLKEVVISHRERIYGQSKYGVYIKLLKGMPEVIRFIFKLKTGYYNLSTQGSHLKRSSALEK